MPVPKMNNINRVAICGAPGVGKTSIFRWLTGREHDHDHYIPTMGIDCSTQANSNVMYYDFAGDKSYYKMTIPYIKNIDLFLMVYDIYEKNTIDTLDSLYKWYTSLGWSGEILVVGNKKDKNMTNMLDNILEGEQFSDKIQVAHVTVSARTGEDIINLQNTIDNILNPTTRSKVTFYSNPKHRKKSCLNTYCSLV